MNKLDDDIRRVLANNEASYDLDREEGIFRQWAGIYHGKMRWMAIAVTVESVVLMVLIVLAAIQFFRADDTKWQVLYATSIVLMAMVLLLIKLWGWMQMHHNSIQREIKRLELRVLQQGGRGQK